MCASCAVAKQIHAGTLTSKQMIVRFVMGISTPLL